MKNIWNKLPFVFREKMYKVRNIVTRYCYRRRINHIHWNLELASLESDFSFDRSPSPYKLGAAFDYRKRKFIHKIKMLMFNLKRARPDSVLVFVNLSALPWYSKEIQKIRNIPNIKFVIDSWDETINHTPNFIPKGSKWFSTNIEIPEKSDGTLIPLGVPRARQAFKYGSYRNYKFRPMPKNGKVLVGPFGSTNVTRIPLLNALSSNVISVSSTRLPPRSYAKLVAMHDFVFCPPGKGIDTYRVYETLYRGRIPILLNSPHSIELKSHFWPIFLVEDFEELMNWSLEFSIKIANEFEFVPSMLTSLDPGYWLNHLRT